MKQIMADIFQRIPALRALRGAARLDAECALENAIADAIEDHLADRDQDALEDEMAAE